MNIFNKVALQTLINNRTRTLVTIIGVILSAAMMTAVTTFGTSLLTYLANGSIAKYGDWHINFVDVDSSFVQERSNDKEITNLAVLENIGYAELDGVKTPDKPYLFISGFNDETFATLPITLFSGRLPKDDSEVLVPTHIAVKGGVKISVGDTLTLQVGKRESDEKTLTQHDPYRTGDEKLVPSAKKSYTVVGICERPTFEEHSAPGYTLLTKTSAVDVADKFSLFIKLKDPHYVKAYEDSVGETSSYVLNDDVLRFLGISDNKLFNTLLYSVGGILISIIMIGSIFLIYNSFNISLNERTHQFGILMSVGATAKQLRSSVLFEGLCIGSIGIPIGLLTGVGSIKLILPIVADKFSTIISSGVPLTLAVSVPAMVVAAAVSLITILISAYIPSKRAANTPIMECIRQTNEIKTESKVVKISNIAQRIYGLEGTLALKNFRRNKKPYRSIVLSLTLSVVLFVSGNAFGTTLKRLAKQYTMDFDYDICFYTDDMDEGKLFSLYDELKTAEGIYESSYQAISTYTCPVNTIDLADSYRDTISYDGVSATVPLSMDIQFIQDSIYQNFINDLGLNIEEYMGTDAKMIVIAKDQALDDLFATRTMDFTLGSESEGQSKTIHTTLVDTYPEDTLPSQAVEVKPYVLMAVAPYQMKSQFGIFDAPTKLGITLRSENPSQSIVEMEKIIQSAGITSHYTIYNLHGIVDQFRSITFVVDIFTFVFVIMISLIAIANVFNTISTNIKLRRRELAMLRSVGMSDRGFNKMMSFECIFYGMRTLLFGIPSASIMSWLIYQVIMRAERIDNFHYQFPWSSILIGMLSVFLIVFITMLYATSKIKKENIIDALRDDMI